MERVDDIVDYIILKFKSDEDTPLINLKLQKLLYYSQAWHLAFYDNKLLFDGSFEAWVHGPVCKRIYDRFKDYKSLYSMIDLDDVINPNVSSVLSDDVMEHIDSIIEVYGGFSGTELESMTHKEEPWIKARNGYSPLSRCEITIDNSLMGSYYKARLS